MIKMIEPFGFCFGVKNSIKKVLELHKFRPGERLFFIKPFVHNSYTNAMLSKQTGAVLYDPDADQSIYRGCYFIFPAHGMTKMNQRLTENLHAHALDCTCPVLVNTKRRMKEDIAAGYAVIFYGKSGHAETLSMLDSDPSIIFVSQGEEGRFDFNSLKRFPKVSFYPQSTIDLDSYSRFVLMLKNGFSGELKIASVCKECQGRWEKALSIHPKAKDFFIIVGDDTSSNGNDFVLLLEKNFPGNKVYYVSDPKQLEKAKKQSDFRGDIYLGSATSSSEKEISKIVKSVRIISFLAHISTLFHGRSK